MPTRQQVLPTVCGHRPLDIRIKTRPNAWKMLMHAEYVRMNKMTLYKSKDHHRVVIKKMQTETNLTFSAEARPRPQFPRRYRGEFDLRFHRTCSMLQPR